MSLFKAVAKYIFITFQLLEMVTEKLGLGFAARRIFLEDGVEIFHGSDIPAHADVYISTGENYKDPFGATKRKHAFCMKSFRVTVRGLWSIPPRGYCKSIEHLTYFRISSVVRANKELL